MDAGITKGKAMSMSVYIGNIIRIKRDLIPKTENVCSCNLEVPQSKFCSDCGRKKPYLLDLELIDNQFLEPVNNIEDEYIFIRVREHTQYIWHPSELNLVISECALVPHATTDVRCRPEIKRLIDLGADYLPTYVLCVQ